VKTRAQERVFSHLIHQGITHKNNGLRSWSDLRSILRQPNGHTIMYELARFARVPALSAQSFEVPLPVQHLEMRLSDYLQAWVHTILVLLLHGTHVSDRSFIEEFENGMHRSLRSSVGKALLLEIRLNPPVYFSSWSRGHPMPPGLPPEFAPCRLHVYLSEFAAQHRLPKLMTASPKDLLTPSPQPINELRDSAFDSVFDIDAVTRGTSSRPAFACYHCQATDHQMWQCPTLTTLIANGDGTAIIPTIKKVLEGMENRGRRNQQIREILGWDPGSDDAAGSPAPADSEEPAPDFR
jgi:hypothetical protein